jgi:hypothetical protein
MPYENYKEYQEMMRDEAKQALLDGARDPVKVFDHKRVSGGYEVWHPDVGWVFESDYTP